MFLKIILLLPVQPERTYRPEKALVSEDQSENLETRTGAVTRWRSREFDEKERYVALRCQHPSLSRTLC
jgi:hypothetical protein